MLAVPPVAAADVDPWDLVRVEAPDWPGADATSARASVLLAPPDDPDVPWRPEPVAWPDAVVAEGALDALAARPWHDAGWTGAGVRVAVFDPQWRDAELRLDELDGGDGLDTHDCYAHRSCDEPIDTLRPRFSWEDASHGVACAEVLRDVAPGVELHLVRVNGLTSLENAADWAVREGIDLVSMSLSWFGESMYDGTGAVDEVVAEMAAGGVLVVTSAGNAARSHFRDDFRDDDGDGWHEFPGGSERLPVWFSAGTRRIYVAWDDFGSCGRTDLDVTAFDADGHVIGRAEAVQEAGSASCWPLERLRVDLDEDGWVYVGVRRAAGTARATLDLMALGGVVDGAVAEGSVTDPATSPVAIAVGAVRASAYAAGEPESFSSRGPTAAGLPKPDVAGPDGLDTLTYGSLGFYGTSAATPAVAGAIALLMEAEGIDAFEAADRLRAAALPPPGRSAWGGPDPGLGAGLARLPAPDAPDHGCLGGGGGAALLPLLGAAPLRRRRSRDRLRP